MRHRTRVVTFGTLVLIALVAGAAFALAAVRTAAGPAQDRVFGGGRVPVGSCTDGSTQFCSGVTREFSILAVSNPEGGDAYGTVTVGNLERGGPVYAVHVTCLAVSGDLAEIGGVVVDSADPTQIGGAFRVFVRDSGVPGAVARDGFSPLFVDAAPAQATCSDLRSDALAFGYFAVAAGDLSVQDR